MHSREPDFIDARRLVDGYIRFGDAADSIPEYARPVIVSVVAEVLSLARKQEYSTVSSIADMCVPKDSSAAAQIAKLCQSRLGELSGLINDEAAIESEIGRPATLQVFSPRHMGARKVVSE